MRGSDIAIDAAMAWDPGAIGKNGTRKKMWCWRLHGSWPSRSTRTGHEGHSDAQRRLLVPLRDRMSRARAKSGSFVSIHADSFATAPSTVHRVHFCRSEVRPTKHRVGWPSGKCPDLIGGRLLDDKDDVLASVLLDVSQSASLNASQVAAERYLRSLTRLVRSASRRSASAIHGIEIADIPSMLVETAYISTAGRTAAAHSDAASQGSRQAIHRGVHDIFNANPPDGPRSRSLPSGNAARPGPGDGGRRHRRVGGQTVHGQRVRGGGGTGAYAATRATGQ